MRIVHLITRFMRAGSEENTLITCRGQVAAGHEVHLLHGREFDAVYAGRVDPDIVVASVPELVHRLSPIDDVRAISALTRRIRALAPDVVHTHQSKAGIIGRIAARRAGVPTIIHGVHILPFVNVGPIQRRGYIAVERWVASFTDAFINVSLGTRDACIDVGIGRPEQHFVVHSGFDLARFATASAPADWARLLNVPHDTSPRPILLMLAALEPRKRHAEFLRLFPRVVARFPDVRLLLAGEGPTRDAVAATIVDTGLTDNVKLLGFQSEPEKLIALADICVLTSKREGLPRVIMQYLAGGRAVISTALPGLSEVLADGINGIVTDPDDLEQTIDAIIELLDDRPRRLALADGARQTDLASWNASNMHAAIDSAYAKGMA